MSTLSPQERDALLNQFEAVAAEAPFQLLTRGHVDRLIGLESEVAPIISVYLDLSPQARQDRAWAIQLKSLSREAVAGIDDPHVARAVATELDRLEQALAQSMPSLGRGIAMFVSQPLGLWYQVVLPLPLPNRVKAERRPYLRPLFRVLDEYERFVIAVLDNQRARLFVSQLGFIEEVADLVGEVPSRHSQGGWAQMRLQRHRDAHLQWHAGSVAHASALAMDYFGARWMLLSATPEALAEFRRALPPAAAQRLAGEFALETVASPSQVAEAASALRAEVEGRAELSHVRSIAEVPEGGARAVGLAEVLERIAEGRVLRLVLLDDFRAPGGSCTGCGRLSALAEGECPSCGAPLLAMDDVVDTALEQSYRQSAELELVRSPAAREELSRLAPIAAQLRY